MGKLLCKLHISFWLSFSVVSALSATKHAFVVFIFPRVLSKSEYFSVMAAFPDFSLSNLALKVHNSTFHSHSNDLAQQGHSSSPSLTDPSVILCPSNQSQFFSYTNFSLDARLTPSSRLSFLLTPTKEMDLSGAGSISAGKLQDVVNAARPGMVITLPGEKWQLSGLVIRKSLCLKGCPGTTFDLSSKVVFSLSTDSPDYTSQVLFSEMTFLYSDSRTTLPSSMFSIDCGRAEVVFNDCYFRCTSQAPVAACCWMNKHAHPGFDSKLILNGCFVTGFRTGIRAGPGAVVSMSRGYIAKCAESCIVAISPRSIQLHSCVLEDSVKSGVEIQAADSSAGQCAISVDLCDINKCRMHGVSIRGGDKGGAVCTVAITHSAISQCGREAIIIHSADVASVDIRANKVTGNSGSGLWLQDLRKAESTSTISLSDNLCRDSSTAYGVYIKDADVTLHRNECCENHRNGNVVSGIFVMGSTPHSVSIEDCTSHSNRDSGVAVLDWPLGNCRLLRVAAHSNGKTGVMLVSKNSTKTHKKTQISVGEQIGGLVTITVGEMRSNGEFGMYVSRTQTAVSNTVIKSNTRGAVLLDEESVSLLSFEETGPALRRLVSGSVGGPWGQLFPSTSHCKCQSGCALL